MIKKVRKFYDVESQKVIDENELKIYFDDLVNQGECEKGDFELYIKDCLNSSLEII